MAGGLILKRCPEWELKEPGGEHKDVLGGCKITYIRSRKVRARNT